MSGHNRWSKIKRQKEAMGSTKGRAFSKIAKELTLAARMGGGDPAGNFRLRAAMDAAKAVNMPADTMTRAIKKGTGELEGVSYEEAKYEGYGPGGIAVIVEIVTDNKNRTASDMRSIFTKAGGNLGEAGSVGYLFQHKGVIEVKPGPTEDQVTEAAIEAGADDVVNLGEDGFEVRTEFASLASVSEALAKTGLKLGESKARYLALNNIKVEGDAAQKVLRLLNNLEDNDDVQNVYSNAEFDDATLEAAG
jgi:YebC/PmpR family DNA-binding regulatory protein